jgi:hypothetical protein
MAFLSLNLILAIEKQGRHAEDRTPTRRMAGPDPQ